MTLFRGHEPTELAFGTSGLRGLVTDITDLEAYINTRGFLEYLFTSGDARKGDTVCLAGDLRPSTDSPERSIMRAVARATLDAGLVVSNLGFIPTPALTFYAITQQQPSVMVTGSHIPFDRNGIKFNKSSGEVLKDDEVGILEAVARIREAEYRCPGEDSLFDDDGMFREGESPSLPPVNEEAVEAYLGRYLGFFEAGGLAGQRVVLFQHTAVGRDLLAGLFERLGAEVIPAGRSQEFVPIDTEDITEARLAELQQMIDAVSKEHGPVDALISTDGDSDRPLLVGVDTAGRARFFSGDLLGIVVAEYLSADAISVPISCNDAVDLQAAKRGIRPHKTKIGSPYVIKDMQDTLIKGGVRRVVGWEANGGFLTGSTMEVHGRRLSALPTREAALPLLGALYAATARGCSLVDLFAELPPRFSKAGLIDDFPRQTSLALLKRFSPRDPDVIQVDFGEDAVVLTYVDGREEQAPPDIAANANENLAKLTTRFLPELGFDEIVRINVIDGLRLYFHNGDIAHVRPSGNAPQLRIYAVSDTQERADEIVRLGLKEPDGLLRSLESLLSHG